MEHLTQETLARLVDERPSPGERAHLEGCSRCAAECRAFRLQSDALGGLPALRPPPGDWDSLETRLVSEGLVRTPETFRRFGFAAAPAWMQAAAAVVVFLGGTGFGLALTSGFTTAGPSDGDGDGLLPVAQFSSPEEAVRAVERSEQAYMQALVQYRQLSGETNGRPISDPLSRVTALEGLLAASQEAVRLSPADPVFNGFLVNVLAERQEVLRELSTSSDDDWF
jgi:hypothetical protein